MASPWPHVPRCSRRNRLARIGSQHQKPHPKWPPLGNKNSFRELWGRYNAVDWKYQDDAKCPRCGHASETTAHVTTCQDHDANKVFRKSMRQLKRYLTSQQTDPQIYRALTCSLRNWRKGRDLEPDQYDPAISRAVQSQTQIGWQDMIEGLVAAPWRQLQQTYYNNTQSRKTGKRWLIGLRTQLIRMGRRQWLHRNHVKHRTGRPRHLQCVHHPPFRWS